MATASPSAVAYFTIIVAVHFHSRLHNFIFQQDSAPAHRARDTIALLLHFSRPVAPNSPDMYPFDYKIWAVMQQRVYEKNVNDVDELCQCLLSVWHSIGQNGVQTLRPTLSFSGFRHFVP